jgi:hypothetical protein
MASMCHPGPISILNKEEGRSIVWITSLQSGGEVELPVESDINHFSSPI